MKTLNFKWLLLSIILSLACTTNAWGENVTWEGPASVFASKKLSDGKTTVTVTKDASSSSKNISCINASNQSYLSLNGGGKYLKFAVPVGFEISNIKLIWMSGAENQALPILFGESISAVGTVESVNNAVTITKGGFKMTNQISVSGGTNCDAEDDIAIPSGMREVLIGRNGAYKPADYATIGSVVPTLKFRLNSNSGYFTTNVGTGSTPYIGRVILTVVSSCSATAPGNISIDSFDPATSKITLKAAGSAAAGDTWYWQASASGTSTSEAYVSAGKEITAAGTYYLRSYNGECWSDAKSIEVTAADFVVKYAITKGTHVNGDFTISPTLQEAGEEVTLVASPSAGYLLDAWNIIKTADGSATGITVTNNKFTMPAYAVTVNATFVVDPCSAWGYGTANTTAPSSGNSVTVGDLTVANVGCSTSSTTPFSGGSSTGVILGNGASKYITGTLGGDEIESIRFSIYTTDASKPTYVVAFSSSATYDASTVLKVSGDYTAYFYDDAPLASGTRKDVEVTAPAGAKSFAIGRNLSGVSHGGTEQNSGSRGVYYIAACPVDAPSCSAPAAPTISGTTAYTAGQTITLTANCATGADASTTYTWYKGDTWDSKSQVQAAAVAGSNGHIYTKTAIVGDAGTYWCEASNGSGCEAHNSTGKTITVSCATAPSAVTSLTCSAQTSSSLTYTWTKASNASGYVATIYTNAACTTQVATQNLGDVATVTFSTLSASTTYYCKVQSKGNGIVYCEDGGTTSAESGTTLAPTYTVTAATSTGDNSRGTVSAGVSSLAEDGTTTITAVPATGYQVSNWAVSGTGSSISPSGSSSSTTTTLTMGTANTTVTVTFSAINYAVTYSAPTNGNYTISVAGGSATSASKTATIGQTITLAATPSSGYVLSSWTVSKESGGTVTVSNDQFTMPADNVTITATFARVYTVTYSAGASATCKSSDTQASAGANITLATPTWSSHTFLGWYVGDTKIGNAGATYAPTADITVYGAWKEDCDAGGGDPVVLKLFDGSTDDAFTASPISNSGVSVSYTSPDAPSTQDVSGKTNNVGNSKDYLIGFQYSESLVKSEVNRNYLSFTVPSGYTATFTYAFAASGNNRVIRLGSSFVLDNVSSGYLATLVTFPSSNGSKIIEGGTYSSSLAAGTYYITGTGGGWQVVELIFSLTSTSGGECYYVTYDGNGADGGLTCDPTAYAADQDPEVLDNGDGGAAYTKSGYTFDGWYTKAVNDGTGTAYAPGATITDINDNITLYAQWTSGTTYTLTASATVINPMTEDSKTGGITAAITNSPVSGIISGTTTSTSSNTFTVAKASSVTVTAPLTVDGSTEECDECTYRFDSWENIPASVTADVSNIHAKYNTTYSLSYTLDGGDWADAYSAPTYYVYGTGATLPVAANVEKEGYAFNGWTNDDGGASITEADDETWGNIAVTANWTPAGYDITYNCDDADSGCPSDQTNKTKLPNPLPSAPVKDGYAFVGWYTNSTKTDAAVAGATIEDNVTLYAKWAALHSVTVTYGSGGSAASAESASVGEGLTTTISATPATGYNFSAWEFTSNTGSATLDNAANNPATLTMGTADVTVNATFSALSYTVTLNTNGGTINAGNVTSYTYGVGATLPTNVTRSNYVFGGWYEDSGFAGERIYTISTTATGNKTYYAKWTYDYPSGYIYITDVMATAEAPATGVSTSNSSYTYDGTLSGSFTHTGYARWLLSSAGINYTITFGTPLDISSYEGGVEVIAWWGVNTGSNNQLTLNVNSTDVGSQKPSGSSEQYKLLTLTSSAITSSSISSIVLKASSSNVALFRVAIREIPVYPVTYKANGSGESDVEHNVNVVENNMFTRNGYTFTGWNTENDGSGDPYSVGAEVTEELTLYAQWECTTPTFSTDLSTTPHEVIEGDDAVTLTVAASANSGTVTYQWYSNTSKSTAGAATLTTGASYNAPTSSVGTLYYYCVATNTTGGGCTAQSEYATVVVSDVPCFKFSCESQSSKISAISSESEITTSLWEDGKATLTGGTMTNGSSSLNVNKTYGLVMESGKEVTVTLGGDNTLAVGSVITLKAGVSDASGSQTSGLVVSGNTCSPASYTSSTAGAPFTQTYTVTALDGLAGTKSFTIAMKSDLTKTYLNGITVTGCVECTPIDPELSYSKTTIWMDDATLTATPTLSGYYGTPTISYTSSDPTVVRVDNSSTGAITALKRGTATITATIEVDGMHCGKSVSSVITVKDMTCGWTVIAGVTATSKNAGTPEGTLIAASDGYKVNLQDWASPDGGCGTGGKIGGDNQYIYLTLKSGEYFKDGDKVIVNIAKVPGVGDSKLHIYDGTTTLSDESTMIGTSGTPSCGENEIVLSGVPANTSSITLHRGNGPTSATLQNPYAISMKVKRYTCPDSKEFLPTASSGNWDATANWIGSTGRGASLPTSSDRVVISKPATVNTKTAVAKSVVINTDEPNTGRLTIANNGVLTVDGTITAIKSGAAAATAVNDVIIDCSKTSQGALIFEQPASGTLQTRGTVNFYTRSYRDNTSKKLQWQYVGYPFESGTDEDYDGYYINKYDESEGKWIVMRNQGVRTINAWEGLAISGDDEGGAQLQGKFAPTTNTNVSLTYGNAAGENLVGNSWTAPIQLENLAVSDFNGAEATIYIFNTGRYNDVDGKADAGTSGHTAGQWLAIPIEGANWSEWAGMKVIPAFQAFEVITSSATTLSLDYSKVVRSATNTMNAELHAPARRGIKAAEVDGYRIRVADSLTQTDMYLFEDITFTTDFDNGWEGYYMPCDGRSAQLYAQTALGKMAVAALPDLEGTLLGFKPGKSSEYTFSFGTNAGVYYLNDIKTQTSTLMQEGYEYTFTWEDGDDTNRFMISATPFAKTTPTDVEDGSLQKVDGVQKVIYKDHMYIIRGGRVFDATGAMVK